MKVFFAFLSMLLMILGADPVASQCTTETDALSACVVQDGCTPCGGGDVIPDTNSDTFRCDDFEAQARESICRSVECCPGCAQEIEDTFACSIAPLQFFLVDANGACNLAAATDCSGDGNTGVGTDPTTAGGGTNPTTSAVGNGPTTSGNPPGAGADDGNGDSPFCTTEEEDMSTCFEQNDCDDCLGVDSPATEPPMVDQEPFDCATFKEEMAQGIAGAVKCCNKCSDEVYTLGTCSTNLVASFRTAFGGADAEECKVTRNELESLASAATAVTSLGLYAWIGLGALLGTFV